jgi:putative radical SAM enzyme (TIGR03279 family)
MAMKIIGIDNNSPLIGKVTPGCKLLSINRQPVRDNIDFMYGTADESLGLMFENTTGKRFSVFLDQSSDLGLTFKDDKILTCKNNCIFCFVHQQPKGMRRSLYIKDEDYRLSFTHGNFISMSNLSENDIERIVKQRLSPLYISVHTTDDSLRRTMFANKKLPSILPRLKYLAEKGIMFHTQVVVCPGVNDGLHLEKTIDDLYSLYPGVKTVGVVPVGLTKYRKKLPQLKPFNKKQAEYLLEYVHSRQKQFMKKSGSRFVFAADELYILARKKLPELSEYEEMEQFENGLGMMRMFLTDFNRRKRFLANMKNKKNKRIAIMTGESAFGLLKEHIVSWMNKNRFAIDVFAVKNHFWGKGVTVSGLLTGRDLLDAIKKIKNNYDVVLLPPNCLNTDDLFLDDISLKQFRIKAGIESKVCSYNIYDTLKEVLV